MRHVAIETSLVSMHATSCFQLLPPSMLAGGVLAADGRGGVGLAHGRRNFECDLRVLDAEMEHVSLEILNSEFCCKSGPRKNTTAHHVAELQHARLTLLGPCTHTLQLQALCSAQQDCALRACSSLWPDKLVHNTSCKHEQILCKSASKQTGCKSQDDIAAAAVNEEAIQQLCSCIIRPVPQLW
jgi:hypothetical protein